MNCKEKLKEAHRYSRLFDFEYFLDVKYNALNSFLIESEGTINNKEQELESKIEIWNIERKSNSDAPDAFEMFENEIIEFNQFSSLLYNSFFIMSYSIFERNLFEICAYCQDVENEQHAVNEIQAKSYIDQCRKYLEKVIGVSLFAIQNEWSEIKKYQYIRNAVAHNNGVLKENVAKQKDFIDFLVMNKHIKYSDSIRYVSIESNKFIFKFTALIKKFISKLLSEIEKQKTTTHNSELLPKFPVQKT